MVAASVQNVGLQTVDVNVEAIGEGEEAVGLLVSVDADGAFDGATDLDKVDTHHGEGKEVDDSVLADQRVVGKVVILLALGVNTLLIFPNDFFSNALNVNHLENALDPHRAGAVENPASLSLRQHPMVVDRETLSD